MKTNIESSSPRSLVVALVMLLAIIPHVAWATIPEPDNVLHGIVVPGTNLVTAAQDNVVIEVQRPSGEVVASYRMGQNPDYGDHYVVDIPMESVGNPLHADASILGNELVIMVKEYDLPLQTTFVVHYQTNYVMNARGHVEQMDFGNVVSNPSTGYDAWELSWGLPPGSGILDTDEDGIRNGEEYQAGTDPTDPNDKFTVNISLPAPGNVVEVRWLARQVAGPGYEGKSRHYALEGVVDLATDTWTEVPGFNNVLGKNQALLHTDFATNAPAFYRSRVWLEP